MKKLMVFSFLLFAFIPSLGSARSRSPSLTTYSVYLTAYLEGQSASDSTSYYAYTTTPPESVVANQRLLASNLCAQLTSRLGKVAGDSFSCTYSGTLNFQGTYSIAGTYSGRIQTDPYAALLQMTTVQLSLVVPVYTPPPVPDYSSYNYYYGWW